MGLRISFGLGPVRVSAGRRGLYGSVGAGPVRVGGRLAGSPRRDRRGTTGISYADAAIVNAEYQRQVREHHCALVHVWADRIYAVNLEIEDIRQVMAWAEECAFVRNAARLGQIAEEIDVPPWSDMNWSLKVVALERAMREALAGHFDMDRSPTEGKRLYGAKAWVWIRKNGRTKRRPYLHLW